MLHPLDTVVQRHMAVARAFWFTGRTGGVDHVGEVFCHGDVRQIAARQVAQPIGIGVQAQGAHVVRRRQLRQPMRLGQQQRNAAVFDHVAQAIERVFRVQGHIGATRLEDRQQADHHFQRTVAGDPDDHFRADTLRTQVMGQTIGAQVQLGVAQGLALEHQRRRVRVFKHPCFEMPLHADFARIHLSRVIEIIENAQALVGIQQRQFGQRGLRVRQHPGEQIAPMPGQRFDALSVEQVGGVGEAGEQFVALFLGIELQVELGGLRRGVQRLDPQPCQQTADRCRPGLLVVEHHLEQRAVAEAALALQGLHQTLERQVLIILGIQRGGASLLQQLAERQASVEFGAHHLGVNEEADQATGFCPVAVADRHTDAQISLTAVAIEQGLETGEQQHERRHAALFGQGHQTACECSVQCEIQTRTALARLGRTRTIRRQFQQRLFAAEFFTPPVQLTLQLPGFHPATLPRGVVRILDRQRLQLRALPLAMGAIQSGKLFDQYAHRPAIGDDVVQGQHQHMVLGVQLQQADA
ncbi:hypothetical protein D3C73_382450 [compost metagenome]